MSGAPETVCPLPAGGGPKPEAGSRSRPRRADGGWLRVLRARIGAIERPGGFETVAPPVSFGAAAVDAALPWGGLPRNCLHEVTGGVAAAGFAAALLGRLAEPAGTVVWCSRTPAVFDGGHLYGPGLVPFGLDPARLVLVRARTGADLLWALEEALRSGRPAAVLGETGAIGLAASRRLQLAAEAGGVTALVWRRPESGVRPGDSNPSVAVTRWHIRPASSAGPISSAGSVSGPWRADLLRCRTGRPGSWRMSWNFARQVFAAQPIFGNATENENTNANPRPGAGGGQAGGADRVAVLAPLRDRQAEPRSARVRASTS
ncbi:MAG TPA: hypothetical protein QF665_04945 [Alphaproteobacteria bacterium]|nr:hypothetical protein [Alphaproteobacteria bacterium]